MPIIERDGRYGIGCEPDPSSLVTIDNGARTALFIKNGGAVAGFATAGSSADIMDSTDNNRRVRFYLDASASTWILKTQYSTDGGSNWTDGPDAWEIPTA